MSLTAGSAPFGPRPAGVFNVEMPPPEAILYFEESPRRVRVRLGRETLADSRQTKLLHEHASRPVCYFPEASVRVDLLEESDRVEQSDLKGRTVFWHAHAGASVAEDAVYAHLAPPPGAGFLKGYMAIAVEPRCEWLEEDQSLPVGPKDPYHRVDVLPTRRRVRVALNGQVLAESRRALVLYESGLRPRWYLPLDDVRTDALTPSSTRTMCSYKGEASYFGARVGGRMEEDVAWTYVRPLRDAADVGGYVAFLDERVDLELED